MTGSTPAPKLESRFSGSLAIVAHPEREKPFIIGIDLGATHTRYAVATAGSVTPFLRGKYFTGRSPVGFIQQTSEIVEHAQRLSCGRPISVGIAVAGPCDPATRAFELTNAAWSGNATAVVASAVGDVDVFIENDMVTGLAEMVAAHHDGAESIFGIGRLDAFRDSDGRTVGRQLPSRQNGPALKLYQGTGVNIGVLNKGTPCQFEFGHIPFPVATADDFALCRQLRRDRVPTIEDLVGGRGIGPVVVAYLSAHASSFARIFPELLADQSPAPVPVGTGVLADSEAASVAAARFRQELDRLHLLYRSCQNPEFGHDDIAWPSLVEKFGHWAATEVLIKKDDPFLRQILTDYVRRFALITLVAIQLVRPAVAFVGNHHFSELPWTRTGFANELRASASLVLGCKDLLASTSIVGIHDVRHEDLLLQALSPCTVRSASAGDGRVSLPRSLRRS